MIQVRYSCALCQLERVTLDVDTRGPDEDVAVWMKRTIAAVAFDHRRRSPTCNAKELRCLMVPLTGRDRIGGPMQH